MADDPRPRGPVPIESRALDDLLFIRQTLERAASFTAVPGRGGVWMGLVALVAAASGVRMNDPRRWLATWLAAALVAFGIGVVAIARKARDAATPVSSAAGRSFVRGLVPPLVAGAIVTAALARAGSYGLMPGVWLMLYGAGVVAAGAFSIRLVPVLGSLFMGLGAVALFVARPWSDVVLALGFGGLHLGFGFWIARRHGG